MTTAQLLQEYIKDELGDSALYKELAQNAPNEKNRQLLWEFSKDEQAHADEFKRIYHMLTGKHYNPDVPPPVLTGSFHEILRNRILNESGDFRKYGAQYINTTNSQLKQAYYRARTDENVHALRLIYMISE